MALTPDQQAQLEALQAEANAPPHRTADGLKGVLHTVLDVVSGNVPHLAVDAWDALHAAVEAYDEAHQGAAAAAEPAAVDEDPAAGSSGPAE